MSSSNFSDKISIDPENSTFQVGNIVCPMVGFGSDKLIGQICTDAILQAADAGYRIIDSATAYKNLDAIGVALNKLNRQDFYIISKVWHDMQKPEDVEKDINTTLKQLGTDYLDAYLIHWPNRTITIENTLLSMEKLRQQGKIRHIGMCNVTVNHLKKAFLVGVPISWVQVEMNPNFFDKPLYELCMEHSIAYQGWRPLDFGRLNQDQLLTEIGRKYNKSACQIAIKWVVQHGCIPLPGSKNKSHMQDNIDTVQYSIALDDMQLIDSRAVPGNRFRLKEDYGLGFTDEFDLSYDECWSNTTLI